jgi:hypothetical protein
VAKCEGYFDIGMASVHEGVTDVFYFPRWQPSTDWSQGGPIIEREKLGVWWATHYVDDDGVEYGNHWYCETGCTDENYDSQHIATGPTPLVAAMRCYVASKLGDEVEIPEELK